MSKKRKNRKVVENFHVGNSNMEIPDYEIKINGVVPIDYATAINDRQARKEKIKNDFLHKDKLTADFLDEEDRYKNRDEEDLIELSNLEESVSSQKLYKKVEKVADDLSDVYDEIDKIDNLEDFMDRKSLRDIENVIQVLYDFAQSYSYIMDNEDVFESSHKKELEEDEQVQKRTRSANVKKEDKMFSSDDKWLQVYDDLSSEVENEGPKGEVNKQVKIPRGKRFIGPYAGPGDYDLSVYGRTLEDLQWAKKVADHYGVDIIIKEDKNRRTNMYYPYTAILKDIK